MPCASARLERIDRFLAGHDLVTPCVIVDLSTVRHRYRALRELFPAARIYYAVKANPTRDVIAALASHDIGFDLASAGEIDRCMAQGIGTERVCCGNTIKREADIRWAHTLGVDLFAFDCQAELEKLARSAPGARVFCRLSVQERGAEWPLTRKFGCAPQEAVDLLLRARTLGLRPVGVSFHVGSQQTDPAQWAIAIRHAGGVFRVCQRNGLALDLLNVGGGFPAHYCTPVQSLERYAEAILTAVGRHFGGSAPQLMIEPGRYLVGDAGLLRSQVLLIARRADHDDRRWVYLDAGRYNGLAETQDEKIRYRIRTPHHGSQSAPVVLAGPTCDSTDILYDRTHYALPLELAIGDPVDFLSAGAYTASYASVDFNGFPPLPTYCISADKNWA